MDFEDIPDAGEEIAPPNDQLYDEPPAVPEQQGFSAFPDPEPEDALAEFNKAWKEKLDVKRAQEVEHEKTVKAQAAEELANWTQQREIRLKAKKEKNRSEEQVLLETLESEVDGSNTWDRVTKLVDTNTSDSSDQGKADVGRMRKIFIQLKSEPLDKSRAQLVSA